MKFFYGFYLTIIFSVFLLPVGVTAQSSGGSFTLEQTVISGGGATDSTGGNFKIEATIGQPAAGTSSNVLPFDLQNGFWTAEPLAPTAAEVTISGRILTSNGIGIRNVFITLTEMTGTTHTVQSSSFGYYRFTNLVAGQMVIISVKAKQFNFLQPTQIVFINDDISELNFVANEN